MTANYIIFGVRNSRSCWSLAQEASCGSRSACAAVWVDELGPVKFNWSSRPRRKAGWDFL